MKGKDRIAETMRLGREYFSNRLTREEFQAAIRELYTQEPELPLGIGTTTEVHK
jgi:hypothetical protein